MTEQEWLTSNDPQAMLRILHQDRDNPTVAGYYASDRKLRLFAVACCRQVWDGLPCKSCGGIGWYTPMGPDTFNRTCEACNGSGHIGGLTDPRSRSAVEVAERYADGLATEEELNAKCATARAAAWAATRAAVWAATRAAVWAAKCAAAWAATRAAVWAAEGTSQASLLRCLFGNPWQPVTNPRPIVPDANGNPVEWPELWITPTIRQLSQSIYDDRRWEDLPILADALEEVGLGADECSECRGYGKRLYCKRCRGLWVVGGDKSLPTCPECSWKLSEPVPAEARRCEACQGVGAFNPLLAHLRGPGPHARGCWAVDLILGKE